MEKPFPQEEELAEKSARLAELNAQLDVDEKSHDPEPVSYTHLDVYKRQAQSRVENTKGQIKRVLALLKKMREDVDVQIADEKEKQEQLAVETEL